ncbi:DUF3037 domain-containing protein [Fontibacter flavus]|uniref:DUF3037 domain-containing protein n=1 Tax=Fontibacter flavus TaxID=654838 RepID=A0ABV6FUJ6_9BACT
MQGKHLYEYAIIRIVPRVEREEFVNVGIILCCKRENYLKSKVLLNEQKIFSLDPAADMLLFKEYLDSFSKICKGENVGSPISKQDVASRFRWLTAVRSSMLQTSRPHIGFTDDLEKSLDKLFEEYVY